MSELVTQDPNGVVPCGWKHGNNYEVVGFIYYEQSNILDVMVAIKYSNYVENYCGYSCTRDYINVLKDYLSEINYIAIEEMKRAWNIHRIEEFVKENPKQQYMLDYVRGQD